MDTQKIISVRILSLLAACLVLMIFSPENLHSQTINLQFISISDGLASIQVQAIHQDNGPGIQDDIKDKILQPFFTTKKGTAGTGLGLSITNDIIKAHGGELAIQSNKNGSAFIISVRG